jgi:hypothetical protein
VGKILYFSILTLSIAAWASAFGQQIDPLTAVCNVAPNVSNTASGVIPNGALWKQETIRQKTAPEGFGAAVGWINAATVSPCVTKQTAAKIEIRSIRLIQRENGTGTETVVKEVTFDGKDASAFERALFPRVPSWFGATEGSRYRNIDRMQNGVFAIDLAKASRRVYHGWTAPRAPALPDAAYFLEVTAKITGEARLQLGMDYWRDPDAPYNGYDDHCNGTNNCEAWISDWYGDTGGEFRTFRAPRSL